MRASVLLVAGATLLAGSCAESRVQPTPCGQGQYLFRVEARSAEREAHLRLVLRLAADRRFQLGASDLTGRTVWTFAVSGNQYLWSDHRQARYCRGEANEALALPLLHLELPPSAIPQILLGILPIRLPDGVRADNQGKLAFLDGSDRRWRAAFGPTGQLIEWQVADAAGVCAASWQKEGELQELTLPQRGLSLRWRRASTEPLPASWAPFSVPSGFEEASCGAMELP